MENISATLKELVLAKHSRKQTDTIASEVGPDADRFAVLWQLMVEGEPPIPQRSSWAMMVLVEAHPFLFAPYWEQAIQLLGEDYHPAIRRHLIKTMSTIPLPESEDFLGSLTNHCFDLLLNVSEPVAVRVHAMQLLYVICQREPELGPELQLVIEEHLPYGTAGYRSRAKRILKGLKKLQS